VENPAYCLMVHGLYVYMVDLTPRVNGAKPGSSSVVPGGKSAAVYSGFTAMPSAVCQVKLSKGTVFSSLRAFADHSGSSRHTRSDSSQHQWLVSSLATLESSTSTPVLHVRVVVH